MGPLGGLVSRKVRLAVLFAVFAVVCVGAAAHSVRVYLYEQELLALGEEIIAKYNEEDGPPGPEGPDADVHIDTFCEFEYVVFGDLTGRVRLVATPRPHAPIQEEFVIAYEFARKNGEWEERSSYHEH